MVGKARWDSSHHDEQKIEQDSNRKYPTLGHTPCNLAHFLPVAYLVHEWIKAFSSQAPQPNGLETTARTETLY